jgi:hypothetical protein
MDTFQIENLHSLSASVLFRIQALVFLIQRC